MYLGITAPAPAAACSPGLPRRARKLWPTTRCVGRSDLAAGPPSHPGSPPQARTRTNSVDSGIMYDTVAIFPAGARWDETLPAPEYLEVGLEAILPQVREHLASLGAKHR